MLTPGQAAKTAHATGPVGPAGTDGPWLGDAVGLVEEFRAGRRGPRDEVAAVLAAVAASGLGAVCHVDAEAALAAAGRVDLDLPLAGVPFGVKELEQVAGWPRADGSSPLRHRRSTCTSTQVTRLVAAGAIPVFQTTSSELARGDDTVGRLHGVTRNPWHPDYSAGGSSGGSAAAVAGGLATLATATDGGGSSRQPAAFCGLPGLKNTWRIVPGGPEPVIEPLTVVTTTLARSVRDMARVLDVTAGFDPRDPYSAPGPVGGLRFAAGLGGVETRGLRVAWMPELGGAQPDPGVLATVADTFEDLVGAAGLRQVSAPAVRVPPLAGGFAGIAALRIHRWLAPHWPAAAGELTEDIRGVMLGVQSMDPTVLAGLDDYRIAVIEAVAGMFEAVDLVACPTVGTEPFRAGAAGPRPPGPLALANVSGCPAISIPAGTGPGGLPVGLHLFAPHHRDALLVELAAAVERVRPWPLVAPGAPR
ncbi:amidase [Frankia sp. AgKG'84/4]